jgi:hypothetical protein
MLFGLDYFGGKPWLQQLRWASGGDEQIDSVAREINAGTSRRLIAVRMAGSLVARPIGTAAPTIQTCSQAATELAVQVQCWPAGSFWKLVAALIAHRAGAAIRRRCPWASLPKSERSTHIHRCLRKRRGEGPGSSARAFLSAIGTLQAADCHNNVWSFKDLNQPVKEALIIVRPGLEVFFEDTLRVAYCLKRHLLVGHQRSPSR